MNDESEWLIRTLIARIVRSQDSEAARMTREARMHTTPLGESDLRVCSELFVSVFNAEPWNEAWDIQQAGIRLDEIYRTPGFDGLVAWDGSECVGVALGHSGQWLEERHFYLKEMYVKAGRQRQGIGTGLMRALCDRLRSARIGKIYLLTEREGAAEAFYLKCGFHVSPTMIAMGLRL